jgi:hypothetical protein
MWGIAGMVSPLLTLAPDVGVWWTSIPGRFTPRKSTQHPLHGRLGVTHDWSGSCGAQKIPIALPGVEPRPSSPSVYRLYYHTVATLTQNWVRLEAFTAVFWDVIYWFIHRWTSRGKLVLSPSTLRMETVCPAEKLIDTCVRVNNFLCPKNC